MKGLLEAVYVFAVLLWLAACSSIAPPTNASPEPTRFAALTWASNPEARVVLVTYCCPSPTTEELVRFYIPEAQLWGDGRFLWIEEDEDGARHVFITRLEPAEVAALLQEIVASGFFEWDEAYQGEAVVDAASTCLSANLVDQAKTVCETHGGTPVAFYNLIDRLSQGAGHSGNRYRPARAFVSGFQLGNVTGTRPAAALTWEETQAEGPATRILSGFWLEGSETLRLLWEAANEDPYHMPVVEDGDNLYRIILQVPGVSWIEP